MGKKNGIFQVRKPHVKTQEDRKQYGALDKKGLVQLDKFGQEGKGGRLKGWIRT